MKFKKNIVCFLLILSFIMMFSILPLAMETTDKESEKTSESILGDVQSNGKAKAADARIVLRVSAGLIKIDDIDYIITDYNNDRMITAADARYILRLSSGLDPFAKTETESEPIKSKIIDITPAGQYPDYPTGCESVAAIMSLNYLGYDISTDEFIDSYLSTGTAPYKSGKKWYSSDPNESFLGEPRSNNGLGIWAKGLYRAVNRYLDTQTKKATASYTYSETLDSLCEKYIEKDIPVLVWVTAGMEAPRKNITPIIIGTNKTFTWISPNHCMLLVGYDETGYYFNDPITGKCEKYSKKVSNIAFIGNGSQAVIIKAKLNFEQQDF